MEKIDELEKQLEYVIPLLEQKRSTLEPDSIPMLELILKRLTKLLDTVKAGSIEDLKIKPFHILGAAVAYFDSVSGDTNDPLIDEIGKVEKLYKEIRGL